MFLLTYFCGKFLSAVSHEEGLEISNGRFQIQHVVKEDMALEVFFFYMQCFMGIFH
jgi:hypothetical protein